MNKLQSIHFYLIIYLSIKNKLQDEIQNQLMSNKSICNYHIVFSQKNI